MSRIFFRLCLAGALLLPASGYAAFEQCRAFFAQDTPPAVTVPVPGKLRDLCFDAFAVLHSGQAKTPVFVAERLTRAHLADALGEKRTDRFYEDARVPAAERARLADYSRSGLDRGHMAPAADMPTAAAMAQSFALSNMVPQFPQNNRKAWAGIESATRKYAKRAKGEVFVISGPVYSGQVRAIGPGKVWVPTYLYKLVYDASNNRAWAYWLENTDEARVGAPISYEELVRRTGTEFLPGRHPRS